MTGSMLDRFMLAASANLELGTFRGKMAFLEKISRHLVNLDPVQLDVYARRMAQR